MLMSFIWIERHQSINRRPIIHLCITLYYYLAVFSIFYCGNLHFFVLHFFSIYTLFMLYFFHTAPLLCRTFLCINFFMLHYFHVVPFLCCTILILYFVCVALFLCTALFHVALLHVAKVSFCILLLLLS